jgi:hypothetical protein
MADGSAMDANGGWGMGLLWWWLKNKRAQYAHFSDSDEMHRVASRHGHNDT